MMGTEALLALLVACAPQVDAGTALALIEVESGFNPHAIGVVGGELQRQPRRHAEAVTTANALQSGGWNFSLGLAQINVHNLDRLGLDLESALEPCANLGAMQAILAECFERASTPATSGPPDPQRALREALSCYYSGNFSTGFKHGYVHRLVAAAAHAQRQPQRFPATRKEAP